MTMTQHLDRHISDVISEFPGVQAVLDGLGIGCATCAVGTCLLREVIEVHGLSVDQEREAMRKIAAVIFPGVEVDLAPIQRKVAAAARAPGGFSPPVRMLVEEHVTIKRLLALVPWISRQLADDPASGGASARQAVEFIRGFADRFHHAKEEDILFSYFDPDLQIIRAMNREHEIARDHVRQAVEALEVDDTETAAAQLGAYAVLLSAHIRKEDEVLYPFLDSRLSTRQVGEMFSRFAEVRAQFGDGPEKLAAMVDSMEGRVNAAEPRLRAPASA
jgi:hemerythrin-like domain-containing protein